MRRQHFAWTFLVIALVLSIYGGYTLFYNVNHGKNISVLSILFLIAGVIMLIVFLVLLFISRKQLEKQKIEAEIMKKAEPPKVVEKENEPEPVSAKEPEVKKTVSLKKETPSLSQERDYGYVRSPRTYSRSSGGSGYVSRVGYGPVLRISGAQIVDMRTNTYYRMDGNIVYQEGGGPVFEISGNSIRSSFGSYLYELSGSNINKVYGGFYAQISGSYITKYDSSEKYETGDDFSSRQKLVIAALLFGQ